MVRNLNGSVLYTNDVVQNPQGFVFSHGTFFCCTEPKQSFCNRRFCEWVKRRTFKRFCRIFYPFFETLDTLGEFWKSTEPFRRVLQSSFIFFRVSIIASSNRYTVKKWYFTKPLKKGFGDLKKCQNALKCLKNDSSNLRNLQRF